ncbi:hypothetical protein GF415_03555 [Candidatus Micrarchaeota archaeon]|nr:hypothetical protein [Candidatus Micrarchaeota archaeon]
MQGRADMNIRGSPRRVGGQDTPHRIHEDILFARGNAPSERISGRDLEKGRKLLSNLSKIKYKMRERARIAYLNPEKEETEMKKLAYGLAVLDFVEAVNKHAEKSTEATSGDYEIFCNSVAIFTDFLKDKYFSAEFDKIELALYMMESALEACSEIYGMGPLLFEDTSRRYTEKAREFFEDSKKHDSELRAFVALRVKKLEENLKEGKGALKTEITEKILKALETPGSRGVKYQINNRKYDGASMHEPTEEFLLFSKGDTEEVQLKKLDSAGEHYLELLKHELGFLKGMRGKFRNELPITAAERENISEIRSGKHEKRITIIG